MGFFDRLFTRRPTYRWETVPTITPEMIEPKGAPISRKDAAKGYVTFYRDYLGCEEYAEEARQEFLDYVSSHLAWLEYQRDETQQRLKMAKLALHIVDDGLDRADNDECLWGNTYGSEPIEETIARRKARLDRQNAEIDLLKSDYRHLLAKFINRQVDEYKVSAGLKKQEDCHD